MSTRSISSRAIPGSSRLSSCGCFAFAALFFLAGVGISVPLFALPMYRAWQARSWVEVPCSIQEIGVATHPGEDGATYSVAARYSYRWGDRSFVGDRFDFSIGSDSGYGAKEEAVARHPLGPGRCWVDPKDPSQSVVEPRSGVVWWMPLLALPFVGAGAVGLWTVAAATLGGGATRGERRAASWLPRRAASPSGPVAARDVLVVPAAAPGSALVLRPAATPVGKLAATTAAAVFWNGIVGIFVWRLVVDWQRGGGIDGCLTAFLVPFVLVGLGLLAGVPYQLLALFNPRPELTLEPGRLVLGSPVRIAWRFTGADGRIGRLTITMRARESATYRRGTDSHTDRHVVFERELVRRERGDLLARGEVRLDLPAQTMHSFEAPNNRIEWSLDLHGEIARWPDVEESFPLTVEPPRRT